MLFLFWLSELGIEELVDFFIFLKTKHGQNFHKNEAMLIKGALLTQKLLKVNFQKVAFIQPYCDKR